MPGTGVRANELRSNPIKTQPFGQGLASYKSTRRRSPFMPGTGARANELRTQPNQNTTLRPEGWPPTNTPCRRSPFMPGTGARANELRA
ncbi:MAG: hypothetical protein ACJATC_002640 [Neptuniibacter pectenicola]|jgi:hypothetical protein